MADQEYARDSIKERLIYSCSREKGMLMLINLDNFQIFKYVYGEDIANELIAGVRKALEDNTDEDDIRGNVGLDEFIIFSKSITDKVAFARLYGNLRNKLAEYAKRLVGEDMKLALGVSVGVVSVPDEGTDFKELFQKASAALEHVKASGSQGCAFYGNVDKLSNETSVADRIQTVKRGLDETGERGALWLDYDHFSVVYRYIKRYIQTYKTRAVAMLLTVTPVGNFMAEDELAEITNEFGMTVSSVFRKSDIMMQSRPHQFMLILPEMDDNYISKTFARLMNTWQTSENYYKVKIDYEYESITAPSN